MKISKEKLARIIAEETAKVLQEDSFRDGVWMNNVAAEEYDGMDDVDKRTMRGILRNKHMQDSRYAPDDDAHFEANIKGTVAAPGAPAAPAAPAAADAAPAAPAAAPAAPTAAPAPAAPKAGGAPRGGGATGDNAIVKEIQQLLGFPVPEQDGIFGPKTTKAVQSFFASQRMPVPNTFTKQRDEIKRLKGGAGASGGGAGGGGAGGGGGGAGGTGAGGWSVLDDAELGGLVDRMIDYLDAPTTVNDLQSAAGELESLDKKLIDSNGDGEGDYPAIFAFIKRYDEDQNFGESWADALGALTGDPSLKGVGASALAGAAYGGPVGAVGGAVAGLAGNYIGKMRRGAEGAGSQRKLVSLTRRLKKDGAKWIADNAAKVDADAKRDYGTDGEPIPAAPAAPGAAPAAPGAAAPAAAPAAPGAAAPAPVAESYVRVDKKYLQQVIFEETLKFKKAMQKFSKKK